MKQTPPKKIAISPRLKPKRKAKKQGTITQGKIVKYSLMLLLASFIIAPAYQYRHGFLYYLGFKTNKRIEALSKKESELSDVRMYEIISRHKNRVFGIDVSHYQGAIQWDSVKAGNADFPINFVFIRATAGSKRTDNAYKTNWEEAKAKGFFRGAYHYYRPDENSLKQAENFINAVTLSKGDLPPVLDIEKIPGEQSMNSLKSGLKRWLVTVEKHYGIKPVIYSGESFYTDFLKKEFEGYSLWIANYSFFEDEIRKEWLFWQFTDKAAVKGINGNVDVNIYNGNLGELKNLSLKN